MNRLQITTYLEYTLFYVTHFPITFMGLSIMLYYMMGGSLLAFIYVFLFLTIGRMLKLRRNTFSLLKRALMRVNQPENTVVTYGKVEKCKCVYAHNGEIFTIKAVAKNATTVIKVYAQVDGELLEIKRVITPSETVLMTYSGLSRFLP